MVVEVVLAEIGLVGTRSRCPRERETCRHHMESMMLRSIGERSCEPGERGAELNTEIVENCGSHERRAQTVLKLEVAERVAENLRDCGASDIA